MAMVEVNTTACEAEMEALKEEIKELQNRNELFESKVNSLKFKNEYLKGQIDAYKFILCVNREV